MFSDVDLDGLAVQVVAHPDAGMPDPWGSRELDAVESYERLIRWAEERKAAHVAALAAGRKKSLTDAELVRSVAGELSMVLGIGRTTAVRLVCFAQILSGGRHPRLRAALASGEVSMPAARMVVQTCAPARGDVARRVDAQLTPQMGGVTVKKAGRLAREAVAGQEPVADLARAVQARRDRFVTITAEADGVARLEARLPAEAAVACFGALHGHALAVNAAGDDERTVSQVMADTLVERVTGATRADDLPVEVGLVMSSDDLVGDRNGPAELVGYGPLPAPLARQLSAGSRAWLRRVFTDPAGDLTGIDTRRRRFDGPLAKLIRLRDQTCAAPSCDAPIRDLDHVIAHRNGGATSLGNGQGLCRADNLLKETPGWHTHSTGHGTVWTTPTGRRHHTRHRPIGGHTTHQPPPTSRIERHLTRTLIAHILDTDDDPG